MGIQKDDRANVRILQQVYALLELLEGLQGNNEGGNGGQE